MNSKTLSFEQLGLSVNLLRAISEQGYTKPTPIQEQAIPVILGGSDVMGRAQTGTGKTASFTLPMLQRLEIHANSSASPAKHPVRALILVPTRELAMQVYESAKIYGKYSALKSTAIFGGVSIDTQITIVRNGVEVLVATPGRLLDHLQQKTLSLAKVEVLVLDEADRMLDMGFLPDIKQITQLLPEQRQNLMFSATFSEEIKKLAGKILRNPILIEVAKQDSVSELITHIMYPVDLRRKKEMIIHLINSLNLQQVLVFTRTKHGADRLAEQLEQQGISSAAIHGDRSQLQRIQALNDFKQDLIRVLVATDVAARGLDIEELTHVINFDLPNNPEDYVHRIGRTGRAGVKGSAISLVCKEDNDSLAGIEKLLGFKIKTESLAGFELREASTQISDKPTDTATHKPGRNARVDQTRRTDPHKKPADAVVHPLRKEPMTGRTKRGTKTDDPLFTQPYVPKFAQDTVAAVEKTPLNHQAIRRRSRYSDRPLPALFTLPAKKQESTS